MAQQSGQPVATVVAGPRVSQRIGNRVGEAQCIIQFTVSQQPGIGGDRDATELQHHPTVKIEAQSTLVRFIRRVRHRCPDWL